MDTPELESNVVDISNTPKRRGRPPKDGNTKQTPKKVVKKDSVELLARSLAGIHILAAHLTSTPELQLSDNESDAISTALSQVIDYYDFEVNEQFQMWLNLGTTLSVVYGSKYLKYKARIALEKEMAEKEQAEKDNQAYKEVIS